MENLKLKLIYLNPTLLRGAFATPYQKMANPPKNDDPKELKLRDFSYISMINPPIAFPISH